MRVLVVGDLQILAIDPTSERTKIIKDSLAWVLQVIDHYRPEMFVHLGDLGESHQGIDHHSLGLVSQFIADVGKRFQKGMAFWLAGNHDFYTKDGDVNFMSSLKPLMEGHNIAVPWSNGPENTMFCSYLSDKNHLRADLGLVWEENSNCVLFSHVPIQGATMRHGCFDPTGVDPNSLPVYTFVGHYHHPGFPTTGSSSGRWVWYAGSPFSWDYRDNVYGLRPDQQRRGVLLTDVVGGHVVTAPMLLENPHTDYYASFHANIGPDGYPDDSWFRTQFAIPPERTHLKLVVPRGYESLAEHALGSVVKELKILTQSDEPVTNATQTAINSNTPAMDVIASYVDSKKQPWNGLNPESLKTVGCSLMQQQPVVQV